LDFCGKISKKLHQKGKVPKKLKLFTAGLSYKTKDKRFEMIKNMLCNCTTKNILATFSKNG
jgi:hypothetical protein